MDTPANEANLEQNEKDPFELWEEQFRREDESELRRIQDEEYAKSHLADRGSFFLGCFFWGLACAFGGGIWYMFHSLYYVRR